MILVSRNCRSLVLDFLKRLQQNDENINTVIAPNFACKSAVEPYLILDFNILFYDVVDCRPDELEIIQHMQSCPSSIVLWVNYFGINDLRERFRSEVRKHNGYLHLDYAQCLPPRKLQTFNNEFLTYSLRKVDVANVAILESTILSESEFTEFYPDTKSMPDFTTQNKRNSPFFIFTKSCLKLFINFFKIKRNIMNIEKNNFSHKVYRFLSIDSMSVRAKFLKQQSRSIDQKSMNDLILQLSIYSSARLLTHDLQHCSGIGFQLSHRMHGIAILFLSIHGYEAYVWPYRDAIIHDRKKDILVAKKKYVKE